MLPLSLVNEKMSRLSDWALEGEAITKDFKFNDFRESLWFVNKVGELAEKMMHHPDMTVSYNKVRLSLTTHSERGLTSIDFEVAEEIDKIGKEK